MVKMCAEFDCGERATKAGRNLGRYCDIHRALAKKRRRAKMNSRHSEEGSSAARGYGNAHRKARLRWAEVVKRGDAVCARCGRPIDPDDRFDLDHSDDRLSYIGVSHDFCNRATSAHRVERERKMPRRIREVRIAVD